MPEPAEADEEADEKFKQDPFDSKEHLTLLALGTRRRQPHNVPPRAKPRQPWNVYEATYSPRQPREQGDPACVPARPRPAHFHSKTTSPDVVIPFSSPLLLPAV